MWRMYIMDFKQSLILSSIIILGIVGIFTGYLVYQNNVKIHRDFVAAQDAFRNADLQQAERLLQDEPPRDIARDFYILKYNVQINSNKIYQAEETCFKLLKLNQKDAFSNYLLSLIYYNLGDSDKTELYLKNAVKYSPDNVDYKIALANFYANTGKDDEAINLFLELKELIPGYEVAWATIATIYENKGDYDNALKFRKEAAEKFSDNSYDLYMLAALYNKMGKKDLAAEYYAKTAKLDTQGNTDAKSKYFEITGKPYHSAPQFKNESIPYQNVNGLMLVNVSVNGIPARFLIDTGASTSVVYANFLKNKHIPVKTNIFGISQSANGTKTVTPVVNLDIKLGSQEFKEVKTFVMPVENKAFDGIIGSDILEKLDYYADRQRQVITIRSVN